MNLQLAKGINLIAFRVSFSFFALSLWLIELASPFRSQYSSSSRCFLADVGLRFGGSWVDFGVVCSIADGSSWDKVSSSVSSFRTSSPASTIVSLSVVGVGDG